MTQQKIALVTFYFDGNQAETFQQLKTLDNKMPVSKKVTTCFELKNKPICPNWATLNLPKKKNWAQFGHTWASFWSGQLDKANLRYLIFKASTKHQLKFTLSTKSNSLSQ